MPRWAAALALGLLLLTAAPLAAQGRGPPLRVRGRNPLSFNVLLPGVPGAVPRTDPVQGGQFEIRGRHGALIMMQFILPTALVGPGGATLPVRFGSDDAGYAVDPQSPQVGFDPNAPYTDRLAKNGRGQVFIGGTASPQASQRAGAYSAQLILLVADTGT